MLVYQVIEIGIAGSIFRRRSTPTRKKNGDVPLFTAQAFSINGELHMCQVFTFLLIGVIYSILIIGTTPFGIRSHAVVLTVLGEVLCLAVWRTLRE